MVLLIIRGTCVYHNNYHPDFEVLPIFFFITSFSKMELQSVTLKL